MKKQTYTASAIRHLALTPEGNILAAGLFEHMVSLWNMGSGDCISEFETVLDFGGSRLALSETESACLTAAYNIHGLACYEIPSGVLRWKRKDLKKIQEIVISPDGMLIYCCFDYSPCQVVRISNGETIERIRGVHRVWIDPANRFQLFVSNTLSVWNKQGKRLFKINPESFAVLDASFSNQYLVISEPGKDVRFFELSSGQEIYRFAQQKNSHILKLSVFPDDSLVHGVQWNYFKGGPHYLLRFGPNLVPFPVTQFRVFIKTMPHVYADDRFSNPAS